MLYYCNNNDVICGIFMRICNDASVVVIVGLSKKKKQSKILLTDGFAELADNHA